MLASGRRQVFLRGAGALILVTHLLLVHLTALSCASDLESLPVNFESPPDEERIEIDWDQGEFELEPDPPFLGEKWVQALAQTFDRMCNEWDMKEENGENAGDGYYHPRKGERHLNPAFDLTSSGTTERPWDPIRLAAFAREKGLTNGTKWVPELNTTADQLPRHWIEGEPAYARNFTPSHWQSLNVHGTDTWDNDTFALPGSMDANTDPWFKANQDTDTSRTVESNCPWVNEALDKRIDEQLQKFEQICKDEDEARSTGDKTYTGVVNSLSPDEDHLHYNYVSKPASMTMLNRRRTAAFASNAWVDNEDALPGKDWNPESAAMVWGFRTDTEQTLGSIVAGKHHANYPAGYTGFEEAGGDEGVEFEDPAEEQGGGLPGAGDEEGADQYNYYDQDDAFVQPWTVKLGLAERRLGPLMRPAWSRGRQWTCALQPSVRCGQSSALGGSGSGVPVHWQVALRANVDSVLGLVTHSTGRRCSLRMSATAAVLPLLSVSK